MIFSLIFSASALLCLNLACSQIFRSACRRDALMKVTDRESKLVRNSFDIIESSPANTLPKCVVKCMRNSNCKSINFKKVFLTNENNCEVLGITKSSTSSSIASTSGWIHYEPVVQVGPRCRNVQCNPGYECKEHCDSNSGYSCIDIDECLSGPCLNGGTCNNEVNKYSCTCPPFYITPICQSHYLGSYSYTTSYDATDGGKIVFLDRHTLSCGSSKVMVEWQIYRSGTNIRYNYKCRKFQGGFCTVSRKTGTWQEHGNGDIHYIDRQTIECGTKGYVTYFRLETIDPNARYIYDCCHVSTPSWESAVTCTSHATPWVADGAVVDFDRFGSVSCPSGYGLSYFRFFYRNNHAEVRVEFRCCKFYVP
ncbi:uncharacterized protein LOC135694729 [Rhopilema esculentum]|uniref:uncharacterized protein LOC135694729 n=1 Tax=Rhopilema esculentum TaxID=499914 RepID=UPI0031E081BC|eukprot:gene4491-20736_t